MFVLLPRLRCKISGGFFSPLNAEKMKWTKDKNGDLHSPDGRFSIWEGMIVHQLLDRGTETSTRKIQNFKTIASAKRTAAKWLKKYPKQ